MQRLISLSLRLSETPMRVKPFFRWYDLWIGVFVDIERRRLYICPFPMFGVIIDAAIGDTE